jgi:hypothetical protein
MTKHNAQFMGQATLAACGLNINDFFQGTSRENTMKRLSPPIMGCRGWSLDLLTSRRNQTQEQVILAESI